MREPLLAILAHLCTALMKQHFRDLPRSPPVNKLKVIEITIRISIKHFYKMNLSKSPIDYTQHYVRPIVLQLNA